MRSALAALFCLIITTHAEAASEFYEPPQIKSSVFTAVKCPFGDNGILEVTSCSKNDLAREKIELYYYNGKPAKLVFHEYLKGKSDDDIRREIDTHTALAPIDVTFYNHVLGIIGPLERAACRGSLEERGHVLKRLNENLAQADCDRFNIPPPP